MRSEACVNSSAGITWPYQSPVTTASAGGYVSLGLCAPQ